MKIVSAIMLVTRAGKSRNSLSLRLKACLGVWDKTLHKTAHLFIVLVLALPLIPLSLLPLTTEANLAASVPAQSPSEGTLSISISSARCAVNRGGFSFGRWVENR